MRRTVDNSSKPPTFRTCLDFARKSLVMKRRLETFSRFQAARFLGTERERAVCTGVANSVRAGKSEFRKGWRRQACSRVLKTYRGIHLHDERW